MSVPMSVLMGTADSEGADAAQLAPRGVTTPAAGPLATPDRATGDEGDSPLPDEGGARRCGEDRRPTVPCKSVAFVLNAGTPEGDPGARVDPERTETGPGDGTFDAVGGTRGVVTTSVG